MRLGRTNSSGRLLVAIGATCVALLASVSGVALGQDGESTNRETKAPEHGDQGLWGWVLTLFGSRDAMLAPPPHLRSLDGSHSDDVGNEHSHGPQGQ